MALSKLITKLNKPAPHDINDQIYRTAAGYIPSRESFPYLALKQLAEKFVSKNKTLDPISLENLILGTIRNHDRLEVALAAFVPSLNTQPIQNILKEQVTRWKQGELTLEHLIEIMMALNHWRPDIVPYTEIFHAIGFMRLQKIIANNPTQGPLAVKDFLVQSQIPNNLIVSSIVQWLADAQFEWLAQTLNFHAANLNWQQASLMMSWMSELKQAFSAPENPNIISLRQVVDEKFPNWIYWANWKPNVARIQGMERWGKDDRIYFEEIVQLEGPCFTDHNKSVQWESLVDCEYDEPKLRLGSTLISFTSNDPKTISATINLLIDVICRTAEEFGERYVVASLLVRQSTESKLITVRKIKALSECIFNITTLELLSAVNTIMFSAERAIDMSLESLQMLLNLLDDSKFENLAEEIGPGLCIALSNQLQDRQEFVRMPTNPPTLWKDSDWANMDKLQKFGISLRWSKFPDMTENMAEAVMIRQWPEWSEFEQWREMLKVLHSDNDNLQATSLMQRYVRYRFVNSEPMADSERELAELFVRLWVPESPRRQLLLIIADLSHLETSKVEYLQSVSKLDDGLVTRLVRSFVDDCFGDWLSIYQLITSLAAYDAPIIKLWNFAPLWHIELRKGQNIVDWAIKSLYLDPWFDFNENISKVFSGVVSGKAKQQDSFFSNSLVNWSRKIKPYKQVLAILEKQGDRFGHVSESFRRGSEDLYHAADLEEILKILSTNISDSRLSILLEVLSFLEHSFKSANLVLRAMDALVQVSTHALWVCQFILQSYHTLSIEVVETLVMYSLQSADAQPVDIIAIEAISELIAIETERDFDAMKVLSSPENTEITDAYFREEMQSLVCEAFRLERMRRALNTQNKDATRQLIKELGIEDSGVLRTAVENLPVELINTVELVNETVFELQIPIDKIKPLARKAVGANTATSLIIRIAGYEVGSSVKFCIHLNTDVRPIGVKSHTHTAVCQDPMPEVVACYSRMTPMIYQLSLRLQKFLHNRYTEGIPSIKSIHDFIVDEIESLGRSCTVCGAKHQTSSNVKIGSSSGSSKEVRRLLSVCPSQACVNTFSDYPIDVRLALLHEDPDTFDMLLQGISAAVHNNMFDSLKPRPNIANFDAEMVKKILNWLPELDKLQGSKDLARHLSMTDSVHSFPPGTTANFMAWVATSYSGFITRATDSLKLPSLPGSYQFLFAETDAAREADFAAHVAKMAPGETTQIMFHATAMSRLPMILSQGLRCLSGTTLQAHGSSFGKGIYLSQEPGTAWPYATSQSSTHSWNKSQFRNGGYGVILGCELAGKWSPVSSNKNIFVVTDPSCVMVRFIILLPRKNRVPIAGHVVPAITSVCAGLRNGTI